jgi:hypothetical protein
MVQLMLWCSLRYGAAYVMVQLMLWCIWQTSAPICTIVCLCHPLKCRIALWVSGLWYIRIVCTATNEEGAHGSISNCVKILTRWSGIWQGRGTNTNIYGFRNRNHGRLLMKGRD